MYVKHQCMPASLQDNYLCACATSCCTQELTCTLPLHFSCPLEHHFVIFFLFLSVSDQFLTSLLLCAYVLMYLDHLEFCCLPTSNTFVSPFLGFMYYLLLRVAFLEYFVIIIIIIITYFPINSN